jgi:hypothetical protein
MGQRKDLHLKINLENSLKTSWRSHYKGVYAQSIELARPWWTPVLQYGLGWASSVIVRHWVK